jgi:hypothetical protein
MPEVARVQRTKLNLFLMWTLAFNLIVGLVVTVSNPLQFFGPVFFGVMLIGCLLALGCAAIWKLYQGNSIGEKLCALFYAIQLVTVGFADGTSIGATWGLAVNFRLNGDATAPVTLNVTAVILLVITLVSMGNRRIQRLEAEANNGI